MPLTSLLPSTQDMLSAITLWSVGYPAKPSFFRFFFFGVLLALFLIFLFFYYSYVHTRLNFVNFKYII
jgi:hypothetical protein